LSIPSLIWARCVQALITAWALATLCFVFVHALPGDLALRVAAARIGEDRVTEEAATRIRIEEGLDRPLLAQYAQWLGQVARGDLGVSLVTRRPVVEELIHHGRLTLILGLAGWALSYLIALPIGVIAGCCPNGWIDRTVTLFSVGLASLPPFMTGLGLITLFALTLRWLPPAGFRTDAHLVLPAATLALSLAAFSVQVIRNAVEEVRAAFYMTFARIKGLTPSDALRRHGVRNAAIPITTFAALQFAYVVDGFVVIETLFNYPGLGELLVKALLARDAPVIMGASLVIGIAFTMINLAADLICAALDPRPAAARA
jgi:peptide/nickel transport system permease protein